MNQPTESQREELRERDSEINPREVWGGSPEGSRVESVPEVVVPVTPTPLPSSQQPPLVEKEPKVIPFTIYDRPERKNIDNSGWKTEILESPWQ